MRLKLVNILRITVLRVVELLPPDMIYFLFFSSFQSTSIHFSNSMHSVPVCHAVSWHFISCCCCCPTFPWAELISHGNSLNQQHVVLSNTDWPILWIQNCLVDDFYPFWFTGVFPGQAEDHRKHGTSHEASKPAAAAWQSQAVDETLELPVPIPLNTE